MRFAAIVLCLAVAAAATGCTAVDQRPTSAPAAGVPLPTARNASIDDYLAYFRSISMLSPAQLETYYRDVRTAHPGNGEGLDRLQLAMLLSLPQAPFRDDSRALQLLRVYMAAPMQDRAATDLALLLANVIEQRVAQADSLRALEQELRAAQKAGTALEQQVKKQGEQRQRLEQDLRTEKRRRAVLEQQLEALKLIEQSLRRDKPPVPPP